MNTWTVFLILSTACVTFCDKNEIETPDVTCTDQVCPSSKKGLTKTSLYLELTIENKTPEDLLIANTHLEYGSWTKYPSCVKTHSPGGLTIPRNGTVYLKSCKRSYTPTGTEGGFDIQVKNGSKPLANIYFDVPWTPGSKNEFKVKAYPSSPYMCAETTVVTKPAMERTVKCK